MASASYSFASQKPPELRSKSCETACSSNSSCFFHKRKPINPLAKSLKSGLARSTPGNSVKQRVLSAKILKLKSTQNQLNDANYHLAEVMRENKALKNLQKRQDKALSKYEGENAELPRLIKSHEEEIRFLTEKNKLLRKNVRELNEQLKHRNDEVMVLQEQLKHFEELDKDKHLLERGKLIEELGDYKMKLNKAENEIVILNRKLLLETKASKQRLNSEMSKHKQCQKELTNSLSEIMKLNKIVECKEPGAPSLHLNNGKKRFSSLIPRQSHSMVTLTKPSLPTHPSENASVDLLLEKTPVTDVKLEPISQIKDKLLPKSILKCPSENIKARLSGNLRSRDLEEEIPLDKMTINSSDNNSSVESQQSGVVRLSRPNSSKKLDKIEMNLQNTIRKVQNNNESDEIDKKLGDYCLQAINSVKAYTNVIENHRDNIDAVKTDTDILLDSINEIDKFGLKLKSDELFDKEEDEEDDVTNLDFVTQILSEELQFKQKYKNISNGTTRGGRRKSEESGGDGVVGLTDKKKLLATLRAIDNGDNTIESFDSGSNERKNKLMVELFGEIGEIGGD